MKIVFENATIQDAVAKAVRVAPTRGSAFDQSAGILITADEGQVSIRATDGLVFYHEIVDAVSVEGDGEWRLPSVLAGGFFAKLKIGSGKRITLEQEGNIIKASSGNTRAKFRAIDPTYFPTWDVFDTDHLTPISNLGDRIAMVQWACADDKHFGVMSGIFFDGEVCAATNRFTLAITPCIVESLKGERVTVPSSAFNAISSATKEARVGLGDGHLLVMPDESTQIKVVTFNEEFPRLERAMVREQPNQVTFERDHLVEIMERANVFSGSTRTPAMTIIIGQEDLAVMMSDEEFNTLGDVIDVTGQAQHNRVYLEFIPKNIMEAVRSGPNNQMTIHYNASATKKPVYLDGGSGYEAWIAPRDRAQVEKIEREAQSQQ